MTLYGIVLQIILDPEPPDDLTVGNKSISCNTYSIKWTEMVKSGELPVTNYKVTVTNANNAVIYNETISPKANNMSEHQLDLDNYYNKSKLFQDLLPNMTYTVHVTTTNLLGESKDNKTVTATTTPKGKRTAHTRCCIYVHIDWVTIKPTPKNQKMQVVTNVTKQCFLCDNKVRM